VRQNKDCKVSRMYENIQIFKQKKGVNVISIMTQCIM